MLLLLAGGIAVPSETDTLLPNIRSPAPDMNPYESGSTGPGRPMLDAGFRRVQINSVPAKAIPAAVRDPLRTDNSTP
jgi:hypothetical protein